MKEKKGLNTGWLRNVRTPDIGRHFTFFKVLIKIIYHTLVFFSCNMEIIFFNDHFAFVASALKKFSLASLLWMLRVMLFPIDTVFGELEE